MKTKKLNNKVKVQRKKIKLSGKRRHIWDEIAKLSWLPTRYHTQLKWVK